MKKNKFTLSIAFLLFMCTSVKLNAQTSKIQIIHNSPDYIIDTVDIWANDVKLFDNLVFRKATPMLTIDSGNYVITISKSFSSDSSALYSLLKVENYLVDTSKTYLAFITGVQDTNDYATNPEGLNRSLAFVSTDTYKTTTTANNVEYYFFNGTPDAAQWDLNEIGLPTLNKVGDNVSYGSLSASAIVPIINPPVGIRTLFNVTNADSTVFKAAYKFHVTSTANVASFKARTACIFSSGVNDTTGNPTLAKQNAFYVAANDGTIIPLTKLTGGIQMVQNSADVNNDSVDVYVNGNLAINDFAFRTATPFISYNALVPMTIAIAPKGSASVADAFYTKAITLDSNINYYMVANGVVNTAGYVANPNGKNIAFDLITYKGARKVATVSKNVDLLYIHGVTDLQATTCRGEDQSQFLSKDDQYGAFHGYGAHTSLDNIVMLLRDAVADTVLYTGVANLAIGQGKGGIVFISGFLKDSANHIGDTMMMFVAWPDGNVDSIALVVPPTGISESLLGNVAVAVFPNPANDQFTINMTTLKKTTLSIAVTDITGRVVYQSTNDLSSGVNNVLINTAAYQTGMYFVTLSANGESLTQKVSILK